MEAERNDRDNLEELCAGYILGDLDEEEFTCFAEQARRDPQLLEVASRLQETLDLLPYTLPEDPAARPPERLRSELLRQLQPEPVRNNIIAFPKIQALIAAGLLVALTGGLGFNSLHLDEQNRSLSAALDRQQDLVAMLQRDDARLVSLKGMDSAATADGNLLINLGDDRDGILTVRNLPLLPAHQVYQVWLVLGDQKLNCGQFSVGADGRAVAKIDVAGLLRGGRLMVTVEPKGGMPTPTGPMVMVSRA